MVSKRTLDGDTMKKRIELQYGQKFGRWTVLRFDENNKKHETHWICECECGSIRSVPSKNLRNGKSKSCGCLQKEILHKMHLEHGGALKKEKEYRAWIQMKQRCSNPKSSHYGDYGGRGISVCERWIYSYKNFLEDMGRAPSKFHSIDRINVDGNYEPGNCKWSTQTEQVHNQRARKDNTTGIQGVTWIERLHKFRVRIQFDKKRIDVGYADTIEEARNMRKEAEKFYWKKE